MSADGDFPPHPGPLPGGEGATLPQRNVPLPLGGVRGGLQGARLPVRKRLPVFICACPGEPAASAVGRMSSNQFPPSPVSWASSSTSVVHGSLPIGCALSGWLCDARRQFAQRWFQSQQGGSVSVNVGPFSKNLGPKRRRSQVRRRIISGRYTYWLKQSRSRRRHPSEQPACPRGPTGLLTRGALPWTTWTNYCQARGTFLRRR